MSSGKASDPSGEKIGDITQIYQTYIGSIMTAEQRRSQISAIYGSILAAVITVLGFTATVSLIFPALAILLISTLWASQVSYLQSLATIKWKTALKFEERLVADPFTDENRSIELARAVKHHSQRKFSELEMMLPRGFQVAALIYLAFRLIDYLMPGEQRFWDAWV